MSVLEVGVGGRSSRHTVDLGARVEDLTTVVREPGQVGAILLAGNRFGRFALLDVEDLDGFIVAGGHQKFTLVVKVQRRHIIRSILLWGPECLW